MLTRPMALGLPMALQNLMLFSGAEPVPSLRLFPMIQTYMTLLPLFSLG